MSSSTTESFSVRAQEVTITEDTLTVELADGRSIPIPLDWYPRLAYGTLEERSNWRSVDQGTGIHWPMLDEDISLENLLLGGASGESQRSLKRWLEQREILREVGMPVQNQRKSYLFSLDYGERSGEKNFISAILDKYDRNTLIGANLIVNNNPYNFEMYLYLNFAKDADEFEDWIARNYRRKARRYNHFIDDVLFAMSQKGYNSVGLLDSSMLNLLLDPEGGNELFLFPERSVMNERFGSGNIIEQFSAFLVHSSKDKPFVAKIFNELQTQELRVWYDVYEIQPGDSISDKINEGLEKSDMGVLFLSKNLLESVWGRNEVNYFFQKRINTNAKTFIPLNLDLEPGEMPPLLQDYHYINITDPEVISKLAQALRNA